MQHKRPTWVFGVMVVLAIIALCAMGWQIIASISDGQNFGAGWFGLVLLAALLIVVVEGCRRVRRFRGRAA